jgi:Tfp pilus assembly protein PilO
MDKILKNLQWFIVVWCLYNLYEIYQEESPKPDATKSQSEAIKQKIEKNKKLKFDLDAFYKNIDEAKLKIQKVKESVAKTQQLLPSEISDSENIGLLKQAADSINIKSVEILPGFEESKGLFITKQYTFKAKATYVQFLILFEKLGNNKRVLNIRKLSLRKLDTIQRTKFLLLDGSFVLEAYRFNPNAKELEPEIALPTSKGPKV